MKAATLHETGAAQPVVVARGVITFPDQSQQGET